MGAFAVTYTYGPQTEAARDERRPEHKQFVADLHEARHLRASGPADCGTCELR